MRTKKVAKTAATKVKRAVKSDAKRMKSDALNSQTAMMAKDTLDRIKEADYKKMAKDVIKDLDYKQLAKDALKIAAPIVVMSLLAKRHKKSKWEENFEPLFNELKEKIKNL